MTRKLTIELTKAEYTALAGATALAAAEWEDERPTVLRSLNRAWSKINEAWYMKAPIESQSKLFGRAEREGALRLVNLTRSRHNLPALSSLDELMSLERQQYLENARAVLNAR